jgi:hypothetical protein
MSMSRESMTDLTPSPELVKEWIREANHNEPMFAQVAVIAARWGFQQCEAEYKKVGVDYFSPNDVY